MKAMHGQLPADSLLEALESGHCRKLTVVIAAWVGRSPRRFGELVDFMTGGDLRLAARAAWVAGVCVEEHPELLAPRLARLLEHLEGPRVHPAVARNTLRMLRFAPVSGDCEGRVLTVALSALGGPVPVAVKAHAMSALKRLAAGSPEILAEVRLLIEEQWHEASPGFRARARREFGIGRNPG